MLVEKEKLLETVESLMEATAKEIAEVYKQGREVKWLYYQLVGMCRMYAVAADDNSLEGWYRAYDLAKRRYLARACDASGVDLKRLWSELKK